MTPWMRRVLAPALLAGTLAWANAAQAQSEASAALSLLPMASVVVTAGAASATAGAVVALPVAHPLASRQIGRASCRERVSSPV